MNYVRKAFSTLGGIFLAALVIAAFAPKAARGIAAALVQIVPGSTTHLGQNESQLVSLICEPLFTPCASIATTGGTLSTPFVVPSGYTLIVTDWEWVVAVADHPEAFLSNTLDSIGPVAISRALSDVSGTAYTHEHYEAGIRIGSGQTVTDVDASVGVGTSQIQGYLVPN